jgi:hypothetical protein
MTPWLLPNRLPRSLVFSLRKRYKSEVPCPENIGDWEEFQSLSQLQQETQLGMCELAHCRAGAELIESVCSSFYVRFLDAGVSSLHRTDRIWYDLAQDSQSWLSPDYPKKLKPSFSRLIAPSLSFFEGGEPGCFHCMLCLILDRSDGSMFHPELRSGS